MKKYLILNDIAYNFLLKTGIREHSILRKLRIETQKKFSKNNMQISPDQGQFLQWLVRLTKSEFIIEIGCFTGYASLAMSLAMSKNGKLFTCDTNIKWTCIAQYFWKKAKKNHKIFLYLEPAITFLKKMLMDDNIRRKVDLLFIDADKKNYPIYYEMALKIVRFGGIIIIDNVIGLKDLHINNSKDSAKTILQLNKKIHKDYRVDISMIYIGGGMTLCRVL